MKEEASQAEQNKEVHHQLNSSQKPFDVEYLPVSILVLCRVHYWLLNFFDEIVKTFYVRWLAWLPLPSYLRKSFVQSGQGRLLVVVEIVRALVR